MKTKSRLREVDFAPGTSRKRETPFTFRLVVARMSEEDLHAMGQRIADLRASLGLQQQYIADHCHVQLRTYQFWQQGKHPPEQAALERLAELFGVTTKYILHGETPDPFAENETLKRIEGRLDAMDEHLAALQTAIERQLAVLLRQMPAVPAEPSRPQPARAERRHRRAG